MFYLSRLDPHQEVYLETYSSKEIEGVRVYDDSVCLLDDNATGGGSAAFEDLRKKDAPKEAK